MSKQLDLAAGSIEQNDRDDFTAAISTKVSLDDGSVCEPAVLITTETRAAIVRRGAKERSKTRSSPGGAGTGRRVHELDRTRGVAMSDRVAVSVTAGWRNFDPRLVGPKRSLPRHCTVERKARDSPGVEIIPGARALCASWPC